MIKRAKRQRAEIEEDKIKERKKVVNNNNKLDYVATYRRLERKQFS